RAPASAECGTRNAEWQGWFDELARAGRATTLLREPRLWIAAERLPMLEALFPGAKCEPALTVPERDRAKAWTREDAVRELARGRLAGRRGRGRGLRARRARARRLRATWPVHARRGGAGVVRAPSARPHPSL